MADRDPSYTNSESIGVNELLKALLRHQFCKPPEEESAFGTKRDGILVLDGEEGEQIVVSQTLKGMILHFNHR